MKDREYIRLILIFFAILSCIAVLRIFKSQFNPELMGYFFGFLIAVILLLLLLYDVYYCGDNYSKGVYKKKSYEKLIIFSLHFITYWIFGVYGVAEYGNFVFGSSYSSARYAYLAGEAGVKGSRCRYSMVLVDMNDAGSRERYCSYLEEYSEIKKIEPLDKYNRSRMVGVTYKKSFLGSELIKLNAKK